MVGLMRASGTAIADTPYRVTSEDQAAQLFGRGSQLHRMIVAYRANNRISEVWALPVAENESGTAVAGAVTITGTATAAGTLNFYIGGQRIQVGISINDAQNAVAAALVTAINAAADSPATAAVARDDANVVTLTARRRGDYANGLDVRLNDRGENGGERTPAGLRVAIVGLGAGASNPVITTALANLGDEEFDYLALGFRDTTTLDAIKAHLNDQVGTWSPLRQVYGHAFAAMDATVAALGAFGNARNDSHATIVGYTGSPTLEWEVAAQAHRSVDNDPARLLQTLPILNMLAPVEARRHTLSEQNILLFDGVSVVNFGRDGAARIVRLVATYQTNAFSQPDPSYLDITTLFTSMYVQRFLSARITQKFPRHKLANDGTRFGPGQAIVTPRIIGEELIAAYRELEFAGLVENADLLKQNLIVERDVNDLNRVNILFPPDYINQLRVFAVFNQFRLQYNPITEAA